MRIKIAYILILSILSFSVSSFTTSNSIKGDCHDVEVTLDNNSCCHHEEGSTVEQEKSCDSDSDSCCKDHCCCIKLNQTVAKFLPTKTVLNDYKKSKYFTHYHFSVQEFNDELFHPPIS